jgi:predicted ATPase
VPGVENSPLYFCQSIRGKKSDARQLLAKVYSWFTEGLTTADLQEAKLLLEKLSE